MHFNSCGGVRGFFFFFFSNAKPWRFCLWSHFFNLYLCSEGWLRRDMFFSKCSASVFSAHPHQESHIHCITGPVPCSRTPRVYGSSAGFLRFLSFGPRCEKATFWRDTDFSNLQATAGPLRRRIISLHLFGAAPVFSCVGLLIWTWCITRLQTIVQK